MVGKGSQPSQNHDTNQFMSLEALDKAIRAVQICIPFERLVSEYLPWFLERKVNPEVGIESWSLDRYSDSEFEKTARALLENGAQVTIHAPFSDLSSGSVDNYVLDAVRKRYQRFLEVIPYFEPKAVVIHTGWHPKFHGDYKDQWLDRSIETFEMVLEKMKNTGAMLLIENVFDKTPEVLSALLNRLPRDRAGWCLDPGHARAFSDTPMDAWLAALGDRLGEVHLHDNDGSGDQHHALGTGSIDFPALFGWLDENKRKPVLTIEAHTPESVRESLLYLANPLIRGNLLNINQG